MKQISGFLKKNAFYVMTFVVVAGILAIAGVAGFVNGRQERAAAEKAAEFNEQEAAQQKASAEEAANAADAGVADDVNGYNADVVQKILNMIEDGTLALEDFEDEGTAVGEASAANDAETDTSAEAAQEAAAQEAAQAETTALSEEAGVSMNAGYQISDKMAWPVSGEVIKDYAMDQTTYFQTLDEYKCNPGILIQGEAGDSVSAVYGGTVTNIYDDDELGKVVEMSLGNGYTATYGQMADVTTAVGDTVEKGQNIGVVGAPTRFYTAEGSHVNLRLTKDGAPIDPLDCLE